MKYLVILIFLTTPIALCGQANNQITPSSINGKSKNNVLNMQTQQLVKEAANLFKAEGLAKTSYAISHTSRFFTGTISLFILDENGNYVATGSERSYLWQPIFKNTDLYAKTGQYLSEIAKKDGWLNYNWRNATRVVYIQEVKDLQGRTFFIGGGYFSFSPADEVVNLVKDAVANFEEKKAKKLNPDDAFSDMSYLLGKFINGPLYIFAFNFDGTTIAHGEDPTSVKINRLDVKDSRTGKYIYRDMIEKVNTSLNNSAWTEYYYKGALKRSYIQKVVDNEGKAYVIGSGYFPDINRKTLQNLVERGYEYLKTTGKSEAAKAISNPDNNSFQLGNLSLFIYDMKGNCVANGKNPSLIGKNFYNAKDEQGNYYVQMFLQRATPEGAWVNVANNNSVESVFIKRADIGTEQLVIGGGIYPLSKHEAMILLVKSGISFFSVNGSTETFDIARQADKRFIRGDLEIFVFDTEGYCLVYGDNVDVVWQNFMDTQDDDQRLYIRAAINAAKEGPATIEYKINGIPKVAFVEQVVKDGTPFVFGSSMYVGPSTVQSPTVSKAKQKLRARKRSAR